MSRIFDVARAVGRVAAETKVFDAARAALLAGVPVEVKDAATRRASAGPAYVLGGNAYTSNWNVDRAVADGYEKVIWVFKAIDAIADKTSGWPIRAMQGREPDWRQVDDPILPLLNGRANVVDGNAKFFRYRLSSQLLLSKAGVFVEATPSRLGGVAALTLLPPGRTKPIPDADTFVSGFEVSLPNGDKITLPPYDPRKRKGVIWIRRPHPTDPYSGVTPLEAAGISIDLDFYARLYNRNFMLNDGRSGQLVAVKGGLSEEDAAELKARFSPGMGGVGRTTVIEADAITVQDTAMTPRDAQYAELRDITKQDLLIALGTPESVLGNASGRTYDNADAERESWLLDTVLPHTSVIESGLDVLTAGGWDDEVSLDHDTSREEVLQRAKKRRIEKAALDFAQGLITWREYREEAGLPLLDVPGSDVLWLPPGKVPMGPVESLTLVHQHLRPIGTPPQMINLGAEAQDALAQQPLTSDGALPVLDGEAEEAEQRALPAGEAKALPRPETKKGKGGYDPNQPRYPEGHPQGGQWMSDVDVALWKQGKPLKGGYPSTDVLDPATGKVGTPTEGPNAPNAPLKKPKNGWTKAALAKAVEAYGPGARFTVTSADGKQVIPDVQIAEAVMPGDPSGWAAVGAMSGHKQPASPGKLWMRKGDGAWVQQPVKVVADVIPEPTSGDDEQESLDLPEAPAVDVPEQAPAPKAKVPEPTPAPVDVPTAGAVGGPDDEALAKAKQILGAVTPESILDYPADYPYAKVPGGNPAKTLKAPKSFKVQSLKKGDVVDHPLGALTVAGVKGSQKSGYDVSLVGPDGTTVMVGLEHDESMDVVARTPQNNLVNAAKKVKAAQGDAPAAPTPTTTPSDPMKPSTVKTGPGELLLQDAEPGDIVSLGGAPHMLVGYPNLLPDGDQWEVAHAPVLPSGDLGPEETSAFGINVVLTRSTAADAVPPVEAVGPDPATSGADLDAAPPETAAGTPEPGSYILKPDAPDYLDGDLLVHPDGSGTITYETGETQDVVAWQVANMIGDYVKEPGVGGGDGDEADDAAPQPGQAYAMPSGGTAVVSDHGNVIFYDEDGNYTSTFPLSDPAAVAALATGTPKRPPKPGAYYHPSGMLTVHEDGSATLVGDDPDLGEIEMKPGSLAVEMVVTDDITPVEAPAAPSAAPPTGSVWQSLDGAVLVVQDDGSVFVYDDGEHVATFTATDAAPVLAAASPLPASADPASGQVGVYKNQWDSTITVHADGTGTFTAASGVSQEIPPETVQAFLGSGEFTKQPDAPGADKVYVNSAGSTLTVKPDGTGTYVTPPSPISPGFTDEWDAEMVGSALQNAAWVEQTAPAGPAPGKVYVNPGEGVILTVQPDGTGVVSDEYGGDYGTWTAAQVQKGVTEDQGWQEQTAPEPAPAGGPQPGQVYASPHGTLLTINDDGTGTYTQPDVAVPVTWSSTEVAWALEHGSWTPQTGPEPAPVATVTDDASVPTAGEEGSILDYPVDYPYPVVEGAAPAKTLAKPKGFKGQSLRPGDVVLVSGMQVAITKVKKSGGSFQMFGKTSTDAPEQHLGWLGPNQTVDVVARTPQPMLVAAAKKAKAAQGKPTAPMTPDIAPTSAAPETPSVDSTPPPSTAPTSTLPNPTPSTEGLSAQLSEAQVAAAKPKKFNSGLLKEGSTITLPGGGTAVLAGKPKVEKSPYPNGNGWHPWVYVAYGYPSPDAHPDVLNGEKNEDGAVVVAISGYGGPDHLAAHSLGMIPKAVVGKKGAKVGPATFAPKTVTPPAVTQTPDGGVPHVDTAGFSQVGAQAGSNTGGMFEAPDGTRYYLKAPKTAQHVENEVTAARLYGAAGVSIPAVSKATLHGQLGPATVGVASKIVDGKKNLSTAYQDPAFRDALYEDYAVHAWLANWDAVGTGKDNIITGPGGKPVLVDVGGSLLYRAMGTPKGDAFGDTVTELQSLKNPGVNHDSADVFGQITPDSSDARFVKGAQKVLDISPTQIDKIVDETMTSYSASERDALKAKLKARRQHIATAAGLELPETKTFNESLVTSVGGVPQPYTPGDASQSVGFMEVGGKERYFHTKTVGANALKAGDVILWEGDPNAPYVVTKQAPKPDGNGAGKMGVWGREGGTGPEKFLFVAQPSSGERQVAVQTEPPPGWAPPPPPPPPTPGAKLVPRPFKQSGASPGAGSKAKKINHATSRSKTLSTAFDLATPEQKQALVAAGLGTKAAFTSHFNGLWSNWDNSSNDSNTKLLAFHRATADEFDLEVTAAWKSEHGKQAADVQAHLKKHGPAYQAAARLVWQVTQNELEKAGIEYVHVWRGMGFGPADTTPPPKGPYDPSPAPPWAWKNGTHTDVTLRPLSSFSWTQPFGGTKIGAVVPREMVFSLFGTGPGTDYEDEMVLLGVSGVDWKVENAVAPKNPGYSPQQYEAQHGGGVIVKGQLKGEYKGMVFVGGGYPNDFTEDWLKGRVWPFVDADGDDVTTLAELLDLYPEQDPAQLLYLPVGKAMPPALRAEIEAAVADPADDRIVAEPPAEGPVETKALPLDGGEDDDASWTGLGGVSDAQADR